MGHRAEVKAALERVPGVPAEQAAPSIAVLPFTNLSPDKENECFGDGLAEEVIGALTKIAGLRVIARTSSFRFRGEQDLRKVGDTLKVRTVLEGGIRRVGSRIRVTAQLIQIDDESHLWSERYDRELTDIFAIQDDIAQSIVDALKLKLARPARPGQTVVKRRTASMGAYQLYLMGMHHVTPGEAARYRKGEE